MRARVAADISAHDDAPLVGGVGRGRPTHRGVPLSRQPRRRPADGGGATPGPRTQTAGSSGGSPGRHLRPTNAPPARPYTHRGGTAADDGEARRARQDGDGARSECAAPGRPPPTQPALRSWRDLDPDGGTEGEGGSPLVGCTPSVDLRSRRQCAAGSSPPRRIHPRCHLSMRAGTGNAPPPPHLVRLLKRRRGPAVTASPSRARKNSKKDSKQQATKVTTASNIPCPPIMANARGAQAQIVGCVCGSRRRWRQRLAARAQPIYFVRAGGLERGTHKSLITWVGCFRDCVCDCNPGELFSGTHQSPIRHLVL